MENLSRQLRIGNYVDYEYGEENERNFGLIEALEECEELIRIESGEFKVRPIPLTEEWLLKFGFRKYYYLDENRSESYGYIKSYDHIILKEFDNGWGLMTNHDINNRQAFGEPIRYIHQLQNIYFALTGEELKIIDK